MHITIKRFKTFQYHEVFETINQTPKSIKKYIRIKNIDKLDPAKYITKPIPYDINAPTEITLPLFDWRVQ